MPGKKQVTSKKSPQSFSKKLEADVFDALQRAGKGERVYSPDGVKPELARIFTEIDALGQRLTALEKRDASQTGVENIGGGSGFKFNPPITNIEEAKKDLDEVSKHADSLSLLHEEMCIKLNELEMDLERTQSNWKEITRLMEATAPDIETGNAAVLKTISEIYRIKEGSSEAVSVAINASFRAGQAVDSIKTILDVSQQLTILTVNAKILAAQAGKYGRGFEVIFDRMEELANDLRDGTSDAQALFEAIRDESGNVRMAAERSALSIDPGVEFANEAERAVLRIGENCVAARDLVRTTVDASMKHLANANRVVNDLCRAAESVPAIAFNAARVAEWCEHTRDGVERSHKNATEKAIEQWTSAGGHILEFAKRMEQAGRLQEETFRRWGELLERLDGVSNRRSH